MKHLLVEAIKKLQFDIVKYTRIVWLVKKNKLEILRAFEEIINQNESLMILPIVLKIN